MNASFYPQRHHRRSIRMRGYDYSRPGAYFVTIMAHGRARLFGRVVNGVMLPSVAGQMVWRAWLDLPIHYPHVRLDAFVIMPDHVHGILILTDGNPNVGVVTDRGIAAETAGVGPGPATTSTTPRSSAPISNRHRHALPEIVRALKTFSARAINEWRGSPGAAVWQRNYYERIVRDRWALACIRRYIERNPACWTGRPRSSRRRPPR